MKKLLLLLLFPILAIGQVTIIPNESEIKIYIDSTLSVETIKVKLYDLQGKELQESLAIVVPVEEADKDIFKVNQYIQSKGIYIIVIQYNKDILRKLIYNK